ncbi:hypothetical protein B0J13DRAFT_443542 [Dactylonectria estremocensis]|uniref:Phosphoglycerate mutase n=1 Tax=Dactylonectria estremocensis TaxID=1079267 RepID=A0A9P9J762_9HYPO|nr:hypothetical protein B0J13DRAFT_443542 [Dactylonectria estremocensis]
MGGTPAYIFVVRHGNRLDAADKRWHLSSPTPYDPPLTYGGFLQSRQVGNQIASILEQAKIEHEASNNASKKRRRFKVVIHSSPFLRCVQTSVGISSGLAQLPPESPYQPSDILVSATSITSNTDQFKSAVLRLDSFLGEWLSPEYFEMITPPPGAALMMGSAKADLLRREDYSNLVTTTLPPTNNHQSSSGSLWNSSPSASPSMRAMQAPPSISSDKDISGSVPASAMAAALSGNLTGQLAGQHNQQKGYAAPKPEYAISGSRKIPEGFVAHARDECVVVDYQWDSMRPPLDFGDGGEFGEEWTSMHKRFRKGLNKMVDWYSTTEAPSQMVTRGLQNGDDNNSASTDDEEVEDVVIIVSHGAGCNALIGAITHQPVLMDVGIASITMATRKPNIKYDDLVAGSPVEDSGSEPHVSPHQLYDIRLSASTDHLRSTSSTPVSARSTSTDVFIAPVRSRGRAPSISNTTGAVIGSFVYTSDPLLCNGSRSTSASAALGSSIRRNSGSQRPPPRAAVFGTGGTGPRSSSPGIGSPSFGLWAPAPSSLRLMDDGADDDEKEDFDSLLPDFGQTRFKTAGLESKGTLQGLASVQESEPSTPRFLMSKSVPLSILSTELPPPAVPVFNFFSVSSSNGDSSSNGRPRGPILSAPIRIKTDVEYETPAQELPMTQLGDDLGGLWGLPMPPGEAERLRDLSFSKRRWTTSERA